MGGGGGGGIGGRGGGGGARLTSFGVKVVQAQVTSSRILLPSWQKRKSSHLNPMIW